jgi:hypothetical protein
VLTPQGEASRHIIRYPIFNGYATQDSTQNKQRGAVNHREGTHGGGCGRGVVHKVADAVPEMESVDHQVTVFCVPFDKRIHGGTGAKEGARAIGRAALGQGRARQGSAYERGRYLREILQVEDGQSLARRYGN